jgi:predicted RNA-binding Zn ribbon-like protein
VAETQASPAPRLDDVAAFVNTADLEAGEDEWSSPAALGAWLGGRGLAEPAATPTAADLERAVQVREALRALAGVNNSGPLPADAIGVLDSVCARVPLTLRFGRDGAPSLEPGATGVDAALARILAAVYTSMADGSWRRLKACAKHSCRWIFLDRSKNGSRTWCSMKVCGNRVKAERFREQHGR